MVSFNYLLSMAVAVASAAPGVLATTLVKAADVPDIITYTPAAKRDTLTFGKRTSNGVQVDPYAGYQCSPWYSLIDVPFNPTCHANNCYRAFLNARNGHNGFHCPSTAFDYCCQWYSLNAAEKEYVTQSGVLYFFLPWTDFCGAAGPFNTPADLQTAISKVNDVCACTLNHQVRVTLPDDYAALSSKPLSDPVCVQ